MCFSIRLYIHIFFSVYLYTWACVSTFFYCVCVFICTYIPVYISGFWLPSKEEPENGKGEIFLFLAFYIDLLVQRWAPDFRAKTKPWVTVVYHTDSKHQEFQAVMRSCMLTIHALIFLVSPAFYLGWSYGYVSWKMLPRMCSKALLGVRKSVPGKLWWATPKASCSQVLAHTSFPSPSRLTFCQH